MCVCGGGAGEGAEWADGKEDEGAGGAYFGAGDCGGFVGRVGGRGYFCIDALR